MPATSCTPTATVVENFEQLRARARALGPKRLAVVVADDEVAILAAEAGARLSIAIPILFGDEKKIRAEIERVGATALLDVAQFVDGSDPAVAANLAAQQARDGNIDILLKGHLRTDQLLHAVLDKANGLRTGRLLSDVLLYEDTLAGHPRLVGITDGGINVAPTLDHKKQIVQNAVAAFHALGFARPMIAIMSATEVVTESVPSTVDAQRLAAMGAAGEFGEAEVFGPLALDNALLESAARSKNITHSVAGRADCMVVPNIESGNLLGKAVKYLGGSQCAHVVLGARVPVLIPSRVESVDDKLNSVAFGVLAHGQ